MSLTHLKTISNSRRNPTADCRNDPICPRVNRLNGFQFLMGPRWIFLEQFQNLKHFMGLFDPNIDKGSRINGQNTLLKKTKKTKNQWYACSSYLSPFYFFTLCFARRLTWTCYDNNNNNNRGHCCVWTWRIWHLKTVWCGRPWDHSTLFHGVLVHQSRMRPGPKTLEACLNDVDKTFSLSGNGLTWICIPSCKQLCLPRRKNTEISTFPVFCCPHPSLFSMLSSPVWIKQI